jgi:prepilin-type N-terminal cleavage/methylation domain-containing protein
MKRRSPFGFTLIELMMVVAILSVLAAIAIPAYIKYVAQSKTAEAPLMLRRIIDAGNAYFSVDHSTTAGGQIGSVSNLFPAQTGWYPAIEPVGKKIMPAASDPPAADAPTWNELRLTLREPVQFQYQWQSSFTSQFDQSAVATARGQVFPGIECVMQRTLKTTGTTGELVGSPLKLISPAY